MWLIPCHGAAWAHLAVPNVHSVLPIRSPGGGYSTIHGSGPTLDGGSIPSKANRNARPKMNTIRMTKPKSSSGPVMGLRTISLFVMMPIVPHCGIS